ncbi:hypothetical protein DQ04_05971030 [Trypanosoma grayi]|uniref:hypothetical protein n=1 Tax=Trypanosoma grayi TaxID=71804 RepID=UPI0004F4957B|nr:hypothetical protein DQ04_05971030 [Trypanosoma grayi]KEG09022.1 hypothetical protein DQ04_05971030 [Trypanosoma grayi]
MSTGYDSENVHRDNGDPLEEVRDSESHSVEEDHDANINAVEEQEQEQNHEEDHESSHNGRRNEDDEQHDEHDVAAAENERIFELHQKRLQNQQHHFYQRPQRSISYINRTQDTGRSSVCPTDAASHLRYRSIISSARFSVVRRSPGSAMCDRMSIALTEGERIAMDQMMEREERRQGAAMCDRMSIALTEGERIAMDQMMEREERRQAALMRVAEEDERRDKLLVEQELAKEAATLDRIVHLEEKKVLGVKERQERRIARMEQARLRREAMEREREARLESTRQRREERIVHRDPYSMFSAKAKYKTPGAVSDF